MNAIKYYWVLLAFLFVSKGLFAQEETFIQNISASAFYAKGLSLHDEGAMSNAIAHYTEALRMDENNKKALYNRGIANVQIEKYNKAILDFSKLLELAPEDSDALQQRARLYFITKDFGAAITDYSKCLALEEQGILYVNRAMAYLEMRNFNAAESDFKKAINFNPEDAEIYSGLGDTDFARENYQAAIDWYTKAIELNPGDARSLNNRANAYGKIGLHESAEHGYTEALATHPGTNIYANRAFYWMDQENYDLAMKDFVEATRINQSNANAFYGIGWINLEWGNYDMAIENLDKALELDGTKSAFFEKRGDAYFHNGAYEDAIFDYEIAIEKGADFQEMKKRLEKCTAAMSQGAIIPQQKVEFLSYEITPQEYDQMPTPPAYSISENHQSEEAQGDAHLDETGMEPEFISEIRQLTKLADQEFEPIADAESFGDFESEHALLVNAKSGEKFTPKGGVGVPNVQANPKPILINTIDDIINDVEPKDKIQSHLTKNIDNETLISIAKRNHELGFRTQALNDYNYVLSKDPNNYDAHNGKGVLLFELNQLLGALSHLEKAVAADPNRMDAYFNKANVLNEMKNFDQAILDYSAAIRISPDFEKAYFKRGQTLAVSGQIEAAIRDFDNCIVLNPKAAKAFSNRATLKFKKGNLLGAEEDYNTAIEIDSTQSSFFTNRAKLLMQKRQYASANQDLYRAVKMGLGNEEVYYFLGANEYELEHFEKAVACFTKSIQMNPDFGEDVYYRRALGYVKLKDFRLALADLNQVIVMNRQHSEAFFNRAIVKKGLQDRQGACEDFMEAGNLGLFRAFEEKNVSYCNGIEATQDILTKY